MAEYLTEAAYQRWYRQYQINLGYYFDLLDSLRIRLDALPQETEVEELKIMMDGIDENLERVIPRNFNGNGESLVGFEKFIENIKVFINLIFRIRGKKDRYPGIYQEEKDKILSIHQQFKFKDKLKQIKEKIEAIEQKNQSEEAAQEEPPSVIAQGSTFI